MVLMRLTPLVSRQGIFASVPARRRLALTAYSSEPQKHYLPAKPRANISRRLEPLMETDPKILFQHLHKELVEYQLRFVDLTLKGAGIILLLLGWMLTSESARRFIATSGRARSAAIAGIIIMIAAYLFIAMRMGRVSQHLTVLMAALEYLPSSYYSFRTLTTRVILAGVAATTAPAAVTIALMLSGVK